MAKDPDQFSVKHVNVKLHSRLLLELLTVQVSITGSSCCIAV